MRMSVKLKRVCVYISICLCNFSRGLQSTSSNLDFFNLREEFVLIENRDCVDFDFGRMNKVLRIKQFDEWIDDSETLDEFSKLNGSFSLSVSVR